MEFIRTPLREVLIIKPTVFNDERGFFYESYNKKVFEESGITCKFLQDNHSGSKQGVLRGLHYQIQHPQGKLVRVVSGEVYDVVVDIRKSSKTFGQYFGTVICAEKASQLWIPPGFAHGFYVLSEWAEVVYKVTNIYAPEWERTLLWNAPEVNIDWPLIHGKEPILSDKDKMGKTLRDADLFNLED